VGNTRGGRKHPWDDSVDSSEACEFIKA